MTTKANRPSIRGWSKIRVQANKISTLAAMRKNLKIILGHWPDETACIWEFAIYCPPKKAQRHI